MYTTLPKYNDYISNQNGQLLFVIKVVRLKNFRNKTLLNWIELNYTLLSKKAYPLLPSLDDITYESSLTFSDVGLSLSNFPFIQST